MLRRSSGWAGSPLIARVWAACCAIGVSAWLSSCWGLATDGLEPEGSGPSATEPAGEAPSWVQPERETCDDNPLLANCGPGYDFCRENPLSSRCPSAPIPTNPAEYPEPVAAARNVLLSRCEQCHGPALTQGEASGSINYIDDWNLLLAAGLIQRCSPERSRIVDVMRTAAMPPARSGLPFVPDSDIEVVEEAIDFDCNDE